MRDVREVLVVCDIVVYWFQAWYFKRICLSNIRKISDRIEIGLYLLLSCLSPFLYIRITIDTLNTFENLFELILAASCRYYAFILTTSMDLEVSSVLTDFQQILLSP